MKLTSLLLALSIFMQPLGPSIAYAQETTTDPAPTESCENGMEFVEGRGCQMTQEAIAARDSARECEGLSGQEQRDCYEIVAKSALDEVKADHKEENEDKKGLLGGKRSNGFLGGATDRSIVPLVMTTVAGYYMLRNKNAIKCSSLSMKLLMGAGIAGITGEAIAYLGHEKRTKKAGKEYEKNVKSHDSEGDETNYQNMNNNQVLAFDYLIKVEESSLKAEKVRKTAHLVATGLYGAAVVAGVVELAKAGWSLGASTVADTCTLLTSNNKMNQSQNIVQSNLSEEINRIAVFDKRFQEFTHVKNITSEEVDESILRIIYSNLLPTLHAQTTQPQEQKKGGGLMSIITSILPMLSMFFKGGGNSSSSGASESSAKANKPKFKADGKEGDKISKLISQPITRIAMGSLFGTYSYTVHKRAKENAEQLEERIAAIKDIKGKFVASGGTEGFQMCEGTKCSKEKFKSAQFNWDETNGLLQEPHSGCVNKQNEVDLECKCIRQKNKSGQNNCSNFSGDLKVNTGAISSFATPFSEGYDSVASGGLTQGGFNDGSFEKKVLAIRKKVDDLKNNKKYSDVLNKADKIANQVAKNHAALVKKKFPNGISSAEMGLGTPKLANSNLEEIVQKAKKEIIQNDGPNFKRGKNSKTQNASNDFDLDFGGDAASDVKVGDMAHVMNKEFKIKGDINNNPSQNLFKILSLRYQRSALRRLFDESGKSSVDEASGSQINGI